MRNKKRRQHPDSKPLATSLAAVVLAGQRVRADETVTAGTMRLRDAAKWAQATGGAR